MSATPPDSDKLSYYGKEDVASLGVRPTIALADEAGINDRALLRKIDFRIVPVMALLYLLSFLDRTNIGNANLFGLSTNLNLQGLQYSHCLATFFIFYVLFEVPSNMVVRTLNTIHPDAPR